MKRYVIPFLLIVHSFFLVKVVSAQTEFLVNTTIDIQFAQNCYAELQKIIGETRTNLPKLKVRQSKEHIALYSSNVNQIILEQATIQICKQFGEQGRGMLIYLLGHELAHFYQQTNGNASFFKNSLGAKTFLEAQKQKEVEADQYGLFIAYLGGYAMENIPLFLDSIYTQYELPNSLENYPSLAQRKAFAQKADRQVQQLVEVYKIANYYTAMGYYLPAIACYQYILRFIQTKELHNNIGSAILGLVLSYERFPFYLPIEADWTPCIQKRSGLAFFDSKKNALATAINHFEQAAVYEQEYFSAKVNHYCALLLMGKDRKPKELEQVFAELKLNQKSKHQQAVVTCLEGIGYAEKGEKRLAKQAFEQAKKLTTQFNLKQLIKQNINSLNKEIEFRLPEQTSLPAAAIDGVKLSTLNFEKEDFEKPIILYTKEDFIIELYMRKLTWSKLSCIRISGIFNPTTWWLQRIEQETVFTQDQIQVGSSEVELQNTYKKLSFYGQSLREGAVINYPEIRHSFYTKNAKVVEWAIESH